MQQFIVVMIAMALLVIVIGAYEGRRRKPLPRKVKILTAVGVLVAVYIVPILRVHPEQDVCVFGPVTNEQYRGYLAKAGQLTESLRRLDWNSNAFSAELNGVFNKLSKGEASIYNRVAIMHATLRSLGAVYQSTGAYKDEVDPYAKAIASSPQVAFDYLLDVNKLAMFSPLKRDAWIIGVVAGPKYGTPPGNLYPRRRGELTFIVNLPSLLENSPELGEGQNCPPVPALDISESFSFSAN
jgi:hypothetical protein